MTHMNMMHALKKWCLLFAAITISAFAAPSFAKTFYAVLLNDNDFPTTFLPDGLGVTIKLKVYNTSTEPATINSLVLCNIPGVTLTGVVANTGSGVLRNYVPGSEGDICLGTGGMTLTGFDGFKRQTNKTFQIVADVGAVCSGSLATWPIFASTGNVYSGTGKFTNQQPTRYGCDVALSCFPAVPYRETSGGNTTTILRLPKPGFPSCDPKSFNVLFSNGDNTVEIQWVGLGVVLKTETDWPPSLVNAKTTQAKTTSVAWEVDGSGNPKWIPVPTCTSDQPPTTNPVTDPFPLINSGVKMPNPDGSYSFVNNPYAGQRAKICAIEEIYSVFSLLLGDPNLPDPPCPAPPPGLDPELVLGCVAKRSILYISDDIFIRNQ